MKKDQKLEFLETPKNVGIFLIEDKNSFRAGKAK
jgi:hypothetical protein